MVDLDKLEELAKAATPGPWQNAPDGYRVFNLFNERMGTRIKLICWTANNKRTRVHPNKANADFIAAANPAAVLELIAALTSAKAEIERLRKLANVMADVCEIAADWDLPDVLVNPPPEWGLKSYTESAADGWAATMELAKFARAAAAMGEEPRT